MRLDLLILRHGFCLGEDGLYIHLHRVSGESWKPLQGIRSCSAWHICLEPSSFALWHSLGDHISMCDTSGAASSIYKIFFGGGYLYLFEFRLAWSFQMLTLPKNYCRYPTLISLPINMNMKFNLILRIHEITLTLISEEGLSLFYVNNCSPMDNLFKRLIWEIKRVDDLVIAVTVQTYKVRIKLHNCGRKYEQSFVFSENVSCATHWRQTDFMYNTKGCVVHLVFIRDLNAPPTGVSTGQVSLVRVDEPANEETWPS